MRRAKAAPAFICRARPRGKSGPDRLGAHPERGAVRAAAVDDDDLVTQVAQRLQRDQRFLDARRLIQRRQDNGQTHGRRRHKDGKSVLVNRGTVLGIGLGLVVSASVVAYRQPGATPLGQPVLKAPGRESGPPQPGDGLEGQNAPGATAVGDYLPVGWQVSEPFL